MKGKYIGEIVFDIFYLITVIGLGIKMLQEAKQKNGMKIFGFLALTLGIGDAFHLVPRILSEWHGDFSAYRIYLGSGKFVTSITMTIFYVLLYFIWEKQYEERNSFVRKGIFVLAGWRILTCLCPENHWWWETPPLSFGILRNIPFLALGIWMIYLFYSKRNVIKNDPLSHMWVAITLSFLCYLPVVLFVERIPAMGLFMIPKTMAYLWMVQMIYRFSKQQNTKMVLSY